jgi:hypothetical protein
MKYKEILFNICLFLLSLLLIFLIGEFALRIYHSAVFEWKNFLEETLDLNRSAYPSTYDPILGWIPKDNFSGTDNVWGTQVTTGENGIRLNDNNMKEIVNTDSIILTIGNSFTFGDEVSNHETWPSYLEKLLGWKVLNGGVFGYGLDQMFIRATNLITQYEPEIVIVSFIPDDILRCKLSVRMGTPKPFFRVRENKLILENTPVPIRTHKLGEMDFWRKYLGYSLVVNFLMKRINQSYWFFGSHYENISTGEDEIEVACQILNQLDQIQSKKHLKIVLLIQYSQHLTPKEKIMIHELKLCTKDKDYKMIDLYEALRKIKKDDSDFYRKLFKNHMTPAGNQWVALQVAKELKKKDLVH